MSIDHGSSSELQPLRRRRSEIVDLLGCSSVVQRCDSLKTTDLESLRSLSSVRVYHWALMETSYSSNRGFCMSKNTVKINFPADS
ncbi:hypothetical protein TNCV_3525571 [Trichonephila clavipes]|uniref:Uncharacterized protein n=1 Tax=Trichonephila clavipes TaxID=2585209 RepID=A0A8X6S558_TRICX|nr:hypothetical protein TNCV_3525571 [Trichonephila clavipes]